MKNFFIIHNSQKAHTEETVEKLQNMLNNNGCKVTLNAGRFSHEPYLYTDPDDIPEDTECIITIGGDGTLISAARDIISLGIPIIGINTGNLGYLAEINKNELKDAVYKLINDDFHIEKRMRLSISSNKKGLNISDSALNDIVILKNSHYGILIIDIYVDNQHLNTLKSDGIIFSTPTGSTGYSLSAGGPIVEPNSDMIVITPINPHTLNARSVILSGSSIIDVKINKATLDRNITGNVICDGIRTMTMNDESFIHIKRSELITNIAKINSMSFIKILRSKMKDE